MIAKNVDRFAVKSVKKKIPVNISVIPILTFVLILFIRRVINPTPKGGGLEMQVSKPE